MGQGKDSGFMVEIREIDRFFDHAVETLTLCSSLPNDSFHGKFMIADPKDSAIVPRAEIRSA